MAVTRAPFPVPVFVAAGADAWSRVQDLRSVAEIELVTSPRHASVLLVAGTIPAEHHEALDRVHDQVPHPRTSIAWPAGGSAPPGPWAKVDGDLDTLVAALVESHRRLASDPTGTEPDQLADIEPNEWRGLGPHGQGGEAMMGGTPYGRPMAMTGDDRDGLALDQLELRLGPFLDALPGGLVLNVTLQGEVVQRCVAEWPAVANDRAAASRPTEPARGSATSGPPRPQAADPVTPDPEERDPEAASPETAGPEARGSEAAAWRHLSWGLHLQGLDTLATRAAHRARAAGEATIDRDRSGWQTGSLQRRIRRSGMLWTLRGVGVIDGRGDAADRWAQRIEALRADRPVDRSWSTLGARPLSMDALGPALVGLTLTDAVSTIASLDLAAPAPASSSDSTGVTA